LNIAGRYGSCSASNPFFLDSQGFQNGTEFLAPGQNAKIYVKLTDNEHQTVNDTLYFIMLNFSMNNLTVSSEGTVDNKLPAIGCVLFNTVFRLVDASQIWTPFELEFTVIGNEMMRSIEKKSFEVEITECGLGEISLVGGCGQCPLNQYTFDSLYCVNCPDKGPIPCVNLSGTTYIIKRGFWTLPCLNHPQVLIPCPKMIGNMETHCQELSCYRTCENENRSCEVSCDNGNGGKDHCDNNYTGNFCTRCFCSNETNGTCFYRDEFSGNCMSCDSNQKGVAFLYGGMAVGIILFICVIVLEQSNPWILGGELLAAGALMVVGLQGHWFLEILLMVLGLSIVATSNSLSNGLIKVLVFYVQMTNVLVSNRLWPDWFATIAQRLNIANVQVSGLECISSAFANDAIAFGLQMLFPWILIGFVSVTIFLRQGFMALSKWCRRKKPVSIVPIIAPELQSEDEAHLISDDQDASSSNLLRLRRDGSPDTMWNLLIKSCLFIFYVGYFDLTNSIFSVFNCVEPYDKVDTLNLTGCTHPVVSYMEDKPWIYCSFVADVNTKYPAMFVTACVFLLVYVIGVPLLFAFLIYKNRRIIGPSEKHLDGGHVPYMSFLYDDYKSSFYWFELLWMGRRVLLSIAVILLKEGNPFQPFLVVLILSLSVAIELHLQPFRDRVENFLEICVLITLLYSYSGATGSTLSSAGVFPIFVLVLNGIIFLALVIAILRPWLVVVFKKLSACCGRQTESRRRRRQELVQVAQN
jgi:hypothetical protein